MLRESALAYLHTQNAHADQTVQIGWFIFKIVDTASGIDLETLDFKNIASYTSDFQTPEQIHWAQQETLQRLNVAPVDCTLGHSALVSASYKPFSPFAFLERAVPTSSSDSGWYVGMRNDEFCSEDTDPEGLLSLESLYELTIHDERFARFWLLPPGYRIFFDGDDPTIEKVEQGAAANP